MAARAARVSTSSVRGQVLLDPRGQRCQPVGLGVLHVKCRRELGLVAGPAHIDDEALAIAIATSRPWSASTSASAMSMPVVTPADVQNFPSFTKIASGSTLMPG
jgi:hypothetical protein